MDYIVPGILQARILQCVAFPFSRGSSQPRDQTQVSCITGWFFTSWATRGAQESWNGSFIPSPADLSDSGIERGTPASQVDSLTNWAIREAPKVCLLQIFPTQRSNLGLLHYTWILYQLNHRGAQEYWSGQPIPSPPDLPDPEIELGSSALQADSLPAKLPGKPSKNSEEIWID